jgi:hypothetical protein
MKLASMLLCKMLIFVIPLCEDRKILITYMNMLARAIL